MTQFGVREPWYSPLPNRKTPDRHWSKDRSSHPVQLVGKTMFALLMRPRLPTYIRQRQGGDLDDFPGIDIAPLAQSRQLNSFQAARRIRSTSPHLWIALWTTRGRNTE